MKNLVSRDKAHVWHPFTQMMTARSPIPAVAAKDATITDEHGKTYIDANSSWWTILHGHGNAKIAAALSEQFTTLDHTVFAGVTHSKAIEIAEKLTTVLPEHFTRVFFSDNGSTSTEVALKMAFQYWYNQQKPKTKVLAIQGAYHGDTFGAMSVGERDLFNAPFEAMFFDVDYLPFPTTDNIEDVLAKAKTLFETGEFSAFIFEPLVQGASGMRMYDKAWLDQLIALAHEHQVITIADEVMTGFYRLGTCFAIDQLEHKPDIICLSKGLTGGVLPMGLTITSDRLYEAFLHPEFAKGFLHGHSFTGNPMTCAAAVASFDILQEPQTIAKVNHICDLQTQYAETLKKHPKLRAVRQTGTILAMDINIPESSSYFADIRNTAYDYFIDHGVLIRPLGNVIFVNPPYCITDDEMAFIYKTILDFLETIQ